MQVVINVEQIKVWARHGVYASERIAGRYFLVDVSVTAQLDEAALMTDALTATYNYETIARIVKEEMAEPCALLEKKALQMAGKIRQSDERLVKVALKLTKLQPPMEGEVGATSVEICV